MSWHGWGWQRMILMAFRIFPYSNWVSALVSAKGWSRCAFLIRFVTTRQIPRICAGAPGATLYKLMKQVGRGRGLCLACRLSSNLRQITDSLSDPVFNLMRPGTLCCTDMALKTWLEANDDESKNQKESRELRNTSSSYEQTFASPRRITYNEERNDGHSYCFLSPKCRCCELWFPTQAHPSGVA